MGVKDGKREGELLMMGGMVECEVISGGTPIIGCEERGTIWKDLR